MSNNKKGGGYTSMGVDRSRNGNKYSELYIQQKELLKSIDALLKTSIAHKELECGKLLMLGHSASSIAKMLNISTRTVEHYIHNLRLRHNCNSKGKGHVGSNLHDKPDLKISDCENMPTKND